MAKQKKPFSWKNHSYLLFLAVSFGVGLSYVGISYFNHSTRAEALPLLQYVSPDRSTSPASYPVCPHLVEDTINGESVLQDLCTGLYWAKTDGTQKTNRIHVVSNDDPATPAIFETRTDTKNVLGNNWYEAIGKDSNGNPLSNAVCTGKYRLPSPDELLTLAFIPCGGIKYCENSGNAPILCQTSNDCAQPTSSTGKVCSDAYTISCTTDKDCMDRSAGVCVSVTGYCSLDTNRSCNPAGTGQCKKNDGTDVGPCVPIGRYTCVPDACSPITRSFGTYKYTNLATDPGIDLPLSPGKRLLADGSYWSNRQLDEIPGSQCTAHTSLACSSEASCQGTCDQNTCSNDKSVYCVNNSQCNFGSCKPFESAVSVNLRTGTLNSPAQGKETLMNVRCLYDPNN